METEKIATALSGIVSIQEHLVGMAKPRQSFGEKLLKSAEYKAFQAKSTDLLTMKADVIGTGSTGDPLARPDKPFLDFGVRQPVSLRQLLPAHPTTAAAIELPRKNSATNAAASQNREGTAFGESAYGFENSFVPVQTIGHFIPISNQVLEDSGTLDGFIKTELLSDLASAIETQLLTGDGTSSTLTGLLAGATAYAESSPITYTSKPDRIRDAIYQVQAAEFKPSAIVLHPTDWRNLSVSKSSGLIYLLDAHNASTPRLWSLPVVASLSIPAGTFLVGDFSRAAILFEREAATVQIARHDGSNFQKNMLTIRATERLALVVLNAGALVTGTL